jgi:hypothetical protein
MSASPESFTSPGSWTDISLESHFEPSTVASVNDCDIEFFDFDTFYDYSSNAASTPSLKMCTELSPTEAGEQEASVLLESGEV